MSAPTGTLDLDGKSCVLCAHRLSAEGNSVFCQCGARFGRYARYANAGIVKGGARPARAEPLQPEPSLQCRPSTPGLPAVVNVLEELRERERTLRPSRSWREEMLEQIRGEHDARRA
jgi:hypothetical protein